MDISTILLAVSLFIIMIGIGLTLTLENFKFIFTHPKAIILGLINQLIILPLIGFMVAKFFGLPPIWAVGIVLIASAPGGPTSNLISHVAKGDIALSVSLTAFSSFIILITLPIYVGFAIEMFMQESTSISLPFLPTIGQIFAISILPIILGMLIKKKKPVFAKNSEKTFKKISSVIFILILVSVVIKEREKIIYSFVECGFAALVLNIITMVFGFVSAYLLKLNLKQRIAICIETGIQNGTMAIVIATSILHNITLALPAAIYSVLMFVTGGVMMLYFGTKKSKI